MTTKRLSFQQQQQEQQSIQHVHHHHHQQQQHQRRPPDVEEALSSMLWTPYERASTTDTSSDDDDELLLQRRLRKSKSQYDYTSVPTTIPPLTPPPLPTITPTQFPLPPTATASTNIVAYITPAAVAATSFLTSTLPSTTSAYYTEDLCDPSVTTPLVPFSNLMLNAHATATATNSGRFSNTAINSTTQQSPEYDATNEINDEDDDVTVNDTFNDDVYNNDNTLAATSSSNMMMMSSYQQKNRISYNQPYTQTTTSFGRIPSLTKWWSNSTNTISMQQQPATSHHQHHATDFESTSAATVTLTRPPPPSTNQTDETNNKQPPSYESLYKKPHPIRPLRQRHQRLNKHLNLFKPVLETLKANVTTITQGRFASLTRPDLSNRVTNTTPTTDNNTTTSTINPSLETDVTTSQPVNVVREIITETPTTTSVTKNENCSTESTTSNNLVHSFTDNFLHEHCPTTQHVAATNVDNEHIINSNSTNNNNNTTTENINGETPKQETLIHQQTKTNEEHQQQQIQNETNTKSKQNQEKENKQNNNFMICQEQQNKKQLLLLETAINKTNQEEQTAKETCKREIIKMNPTNDHREPEQTMNECHSNAPAAPTETLCKTKTNASTLTDLTASLFYDSSSAISLTRSFEANTSYTVGLAYARGSFKTGLQDVRQQQQQPNTYHLTPNKCLAELERLYAEFRASENLREQKLREKQNNRKTTTTTTETENMRLNVPANNTTQMEGLKTTEMGGKNLSENTTTTTPRINPSTSSVFLTTTNSVTTITNPCQRTPSLTIQVNQNNNDNTNNTNNLNNPNNNNNTNNNINVNNIGNNGDVGSSSQQHITNESQQIVLNQAIVNTTTNGVSVINCNYVNNNLNNNNNNNKSITNLCDNATNTTTSNHNNTSSNNNDHYKNLQNISKYPNAINSVTNANSENVNRNNSDNLQNSPTSHSSVPQVLNVNNMKNDQQDKLMQNNVKHLKNSPNTQVNVIQINEVATKANNNSTNSSSTTPSTSPRRTFTSTECQTDDISSVQLRSPSSSRPPLTSTSSANSSSHTTNNRDQRRRERRERRHLQHTASLLVAPTHTHPHPNHPMRHGHLDRHSMPAPPLPPILHPPHLHPGHLTQTGHNVAMLRPMLPDILHNHYPPPYSALPNQSLATAVSGNLPHHNGSPIPFSHPHVHPLHPPPQTPTATILGPPPPPPPAGTTLLTSVISTVPIPGATPMVSDGRFTLPLPIMRRSPSERSGKGCCGQWFAGPPLRALIAVVALGGVACALGGAALGATGLAGPPSSHFTAALLMIGVGVVLVTVSAVAWRMTAPGGPPCLGLASSVDLGRCGRRPCSRGGGAPQGLLYPEFQHRPPPPSYQASMQEYRLRLLLLDRDRQNGVVRGSSPPPTYRSHAGSLLRAPLTSTIRGTNGGQRCESSIGGSEYSFPPSYRSRNATPGTISSERSIETEPSGRLLANEDIPEPLSVEQLSEYNSLQQRCNNNNNTSTTNSSVQKSDQKRNSVQLDTNCLINSKSDTNLNSDKKDDLVTIVTITPQNSDNLEANENRVNTDSVSGSSESREQIEILAHL